MASLEQTILNMIEQYFDELETIVSQTQGIQKEKHLEKLTQIQTLLQIPKQPDTLLSHEAQERFEVLELRYEEALEFVRRV